MPKIFIELFLRKSVSWRLKIHSFKVVQFSQSVGLKKHVGCPTSHLCVRWYRYLSYLSIVIWLKTPLRGWKCMYHQNGLNWHCMTPNFQFSSNFFPVQFQLSSSVPTFVEVGRAQKRSSSNVSHPEIISDKFWKHLKQLTELNSPLYRNFNSFNQV